MKKVIRLDMDVAAALVFLTALGVALFYRDFAWQKIGPIYLLEASTAVAYLFLARSVLANYRELARELRWVYGFSGLALGLFLIDLLVYRGSPPHFERVLQHTAMAIYPSLWATIGYLLARFRPSIARALILVVCAVTAFSFLVVFGTGRGNYFGYEWYNDLATGPVSAVVFSYLLHQGLERGKAALKDRRFCFKFLVAAIFALVPFAGMWGRHVQRTSLLGFLVILLVVPSLLARFKIRPALKTGVIGLAIFGVTIFAKILITNPGTGIVTAVKSSALNSLQHGEDLPQKGTDNADKGMFQQRFRGFVWRQTIKDWRESPVFGLRFVPEVPSWILPYQKNVADYDIARDETLKNLRGKPVSGPHNSYLNILARMGIVGAIVFLFFAWEAARRIGRLARGRNKIDVTTILMAMLVVNGAVFALFHTGFESGYNCYLMWLALGMLYHRTADSV